MDTVGRKSHWFASGSGIESARIQRGIRPAAATSSGCQGAVHAASSERASASSKSVGKSSSVLQGISVMHGAIDGAIDGGIEGVEPVFSGDKCVMVG